MFENIVFDEVFNELGHDRYVSALTELFRLVIEPSFNYTSDEQRMLRFLESSRIVHFEVDGASYSELPYVVKFVRDIKNSDYFQMMEDALDDNPWISRDATPIDLTDFMNFFFSELRNRYGWPLAETAYIRCDIMRKIVFIEAGYYDAWINYDFHVPVGHPNMLYKLSIGDQSVLISDMKKIVNSYQIPALGFFKQKFGL